MGNELWARFKQTRRSISNTNFDLYSFLLKTYISNIIFNELLWPHHLNLSKNKDENVHRFAVREREGERDK